MTQPLSHLRETPSQTAGPYVHIGMVPHFAGIRGHACDPGARMAGPKSQGERIRLEGIVYDGDGAPLRDALIEIWQADAAGRYNHPADPRADAADPNFSGWGRRACDLKTGLFVFDTVKPGRAAMWDGRPMAPHISMWIVARGVNLGLNTRVYFDDEMAANSEDPVLARIDPRRIGTLMAKRSLSGRKIVYRFDVRIQGDDETVFFDV